MSGEGDFTRKTYYLEPEQAEAIKLISVHRTFLGGDRVGVSDVVRELLQESLDRHGRELTEAKRELQGMRG